uniref:Tektin n=1 Tax=Strigamia maritima TaxID=126957 RepID=T1J0B2_STRMM
MARPVSKRGTRWTPEDWQKNIYLTSIDVATKTNSSRIERNSVLQLSDDFELISKWAQRQSQLRFRDRIEQVSQWKYRLEKSLDEIECQINEMIKIKDDIERESEEMVRLQDINKICIVTRDRRQNLELVSDEVQEELIKESQVLEETRNSYEDKCKTLFDEICQLRQIKDDLEGELLKKDINLDVDFKQAEMKEENKKSLKPFVEEAAKETQEVENWTEKCLNEIENAQKEVSKAREMKCFCLQLIARLRSKWMAQKELTDFQYRKRIHQIQLAINQLEWDRRKLINEAGHAREVIAKMENDWRLRKDALKMAETRIEKRKVKPEGERTEDEVSKGLVIEMGWNRDAQGQMYERLQECRYNVTEIDKTMKIIEDNIQDKRRAIQTEEECVEERTKMN